MLGSFRRALSVLNPFGAADEPPNEVENRGEEVEIPQNAEGEPRQPVRNVEGRRSRRALERPAGNHPESHGDHGRDRTVEGRQADANLNVPLAAASSPGDGVRHDQGARPGELSPIGPPAVGWGPPMYESFRYPTPGYPYYQSPATAYAPNYAYPPTPYPYPMGFQGPPMSYGSYVPGTPVMHGAQGLGWQMPSQNSPVVQPQPGYTGHGLLNNDLSMHGQVHPAQTGAGGSAQELQMPQQSVCQDAVASVSLSDMIRRKEPQASTPLSEGGTVGQDGAIHMSRDDSQATLAKTVPMTATVPTAPDASLLSYEDVTVPMEALKGQEMVPSGESCQSLYTGPQMVLANTVEKVSAGAGTPEVRSSVDQGLSAESTRAGMELKRGAVAPMGSSSQMMSPDGAIAATTVMELLPEAAIGAEALTPRAGAPQQSVIGEGTAVVESRVAVTSHNDTGIPQSGANIPSRMVTRDPGGMGPMSGSDRGPGPNQGQKMKYKPDKYDGTADWADYLRHFEMVSAWNEWSLEDRAVQLSMNLTGVARQAWADSFCDQTSPISYDALVSALTQRFKPEGQEEVYKAEFRHRIRKRDENFMEYGCALRRLAIRAFPKIRYEAREDLIVDQFLQSLADTEMRRHVSLAHPSGVEQAISMATEYETVTQTMRASHVHKPKQVAMVQEASPPYSKQELLQEVDAIIVKRLGERRDERRNERRDRRRPPNLQKIECWGCKQMGHFQQDCPTGAVDSRQGAPKQDGENTEKKVPLNK